MHNVLFNTHDIEIGSEMRNWLLFYSLPVLNGVLPNPYLFAGGWITSVDF